MTTTLLDLRSDRSTELRFDDPDIPFAVAVTCYPTDPDLLDCAPLVHVIFRAPAESAADYVLEGSDTDAAPGDLLVWSYDDYAGCHFRADAEYLAALAVADLI